VLSALCLVGKLACCRTTFGSAANPTHATATAMHFPANAGLIFLTDELTNDRYLVDIGATLGIVPCSQNSSPSGPLVKGADWQPIPSWGFILKKTVQFQGKFFTSTLKRDCRMAAKWRKFLGEQVDQSFCSGVNEQSKMSQKSTLRVGNWTAAKRNVNLT
jgi:hypothetical protein